jgi:hypothetical protein
MPQEPKSCVIIELVFTGNKGSIPAAATIYHTARNHSEYFSNVAVPGWL